MTDIQIIYTGPIVKRADAKNIGLKRYFTGKPCKNGHVDVRWVSSSSCFSCYKTSRVKYRITHKEKIRSYRRSYHIKNSEKINSARKKWKIENPEKNRASEAKRRARKMKSGGSYTDEDIEIMLSRQRNRCAEPTCRVDLSDGYHVDHVVPLSKGGTNWPDNLQCLCAKCNRSKGAKLPHDWARENGRLI